MQNKIKEIFGDITMLIVIILLIIVLVFLIRYSIKEINTFKEYNNFCNDKPNFCYCSLFECEFNTELTQHCSNGNCSEYILSEDTKELCNLATKLNDKKTLFEVGCNGN